MSHGRLGVGAGKEGSRTEPGEQGVITLRHGHLAADRAGVLGRFGGCHHFPPARGARGKWRQSAHACQPGSPHAWEPGAPPACAEHQRMHSAHRVLGLKRLRPHERGADTRAPGRRRTGTRATSADRRRGCSLQTEGLVQFFEIRNRCHKKKCTHGGCQNHENNPFGSEEPWFGISGTVRFFFKKKTSTSRDVRPLNPQ